MILLGLCGCLGLFVGGDYVVLGFGVGVIVGVVGDLLGGCLLVVLVCGFFWWLFGVWIWMGF